MGIAKKINQLEKDKRKMLGERVEDFKNEVMEIGKKYKMKIVPIMKREELEIDIKCFGSFFQRFKKEEFRKKISKLGRDYGMSIVPVFGRYGLEVEIQVLQDKDPIKDIGVKIEKVMKEGDGK